MREAASLKESAWQGKVIPGKIVARKQKRNRIGGRARKARSGRYGDAFRSRGCSSTCTGETSGWGERAFESGDGEVFWIGRDRNAHVGASDELAQHRGCLRKALGRIRGGTGCIAESSRRAGNAVGRKRPAQSNTCRCGNHSSVIGRWTRKPASCLGTP